MPYYFAGPRILARADAGIRDFQDLSGKRIVSTKGAAAVPLLRERIERRLLDSVLIEVANNDAAFAMLERGEVNAFVTTDILLYAYKATARTPTQWVVTGAHLAVEPMAIAVRKGDPEFKAAVDRVLSAQMLDGTMARLYARWFDAPIPPAGVVLGIKPSAPLREQWRWPSERTADEGPE
jgi:glutamate/aspartate transport system substrate-binding protein